MISYLVGWDLSTNGCYDPFWVAHCTSHLGDRVGIPNAARKNAMHTGGATPVTAVKGTVTPARARAQFRMDRTERFDKTDPLIRARGIVPVQDFPRELEVSLATFKRDIEYMRSRHYAPITWDREQGGYRFEEPQLGAPKYELPGLWFSPREAQALLTMEHLLESLEPNLLGAHVKPLKARLSALLSVGDRSSEEVRRRVHGIPFGQRRHEPQHFQLVASAVLGPERLNLIYWNRAKDEVTEREVSPQRLVHYRNNWYLDAWCHLRNDIRSFALDAIRDMSIASGKVKEVSDKE